MNGKNIPCYTFKPFTLDPNERQLLRDGVPVPLTPKAFDVLAFLVERSRHLVGKDELLRAVWPDSFVEEANLARVVHTLRKTLGENENGDQFIETVPRKGYRFVAEVTVNPGPIEPLGETANAGLVAADLWPSELTGISETPLAQPDAGSRLLQKRSTRPLIAGVVVAVAISLLLFTAYRWNTENLAAAGRTVSIAILPLRSLNGDKQDSIYKLGIADSLIARLVSAKGLTVRSLSSTSAYLDVEKDASAIGREQKVDFVLSSSYQIVDGKIRVTSQLVKTSSGSVEDTFKSERPLGGALETQDAIAAEVGSLILRRFGVKAGGPAQNRGTTNEEAYRLYLQGTILADKRTRADAVKAIEYFEQAVKLDPGYALAYAGLANAHIAFSIARGDPHEGYIKAKAAIDRALSSDDSLAEAHAYLGEIKTVYEWDFAGAEREYKRALALNPNSSVAHRMYSLLLSFLGRFDESIAEIKTAIDLEPVSVLDHYIYGQTLYFAGRYDEAIAELERTIEMDADFPGTYKLLIRSYRARGDDDRAFETMGRFRIQSREDPNEIQLQKTLYAESGWRGVNERMVEKEKENEKNGVPSALALATLYIDLGMRDQAFAYLEKAFGERRSGMTTLRVDPRFDPLRADPRFVDLLQRVNLK